MFVWLFPCTVVKGHCDIRVRPLQYKKISNFSEYGLLGGDLDSVCLCSSVVGNCGGLHGMFQLTRQDDEKMVLFEPRGDVTG